MLRLNYSNKPKWVLSHCLNYAFGRIDKRELKYLCGSEYATANQIVKSGYFLKNCKLYFYWLLKYGKADYKAFAITKKDAKMLNSCKRYFKQLDTHWTALTLVEFSQYIDDIFTQKMSIYMGKFISKKLYFLVKSYGLTYHDIKLDMAYSSMLAMYKSYPYFESRLHALNTAKCAIHNAGIGIINYYTKACRSCLIKEKDGTFQHKLRNIDTLSNVTAPDCFAKIESSLDGVAAAFDARGQLFMHLATGKYHKDFSSYLGRDNSEYADTASYDRYLSRVTSYMNLSQEHLNQYYSILRKHTSI